MISDPDLNPDEATTGVEPEDLADDLATSLGADMSEFAERYRASGAQSLTQDEILRELNERRG